MDEALGPGLTDESETAFSLCAVVWENELGWTPLDQAVVKTIQLNAVAILIRLAITLFFSFASHCEAHWTRMYDRSKTF